MIKVVVAPHFLPEKAYCFHVLLQELLGLPYHLQPDPAATDYRLELPNGHTLVLEDHFFKHIGADAPYTTAHLPAPVAQWADYRPHLKLDRAIPRIYGNDTATFEPQRIQLGLDIVASVFFLLTRWEEWVRPERDQYGRFPGASSYLHQVGLLQSAPVHDYEALLWQCLVQLGWNGPGPSVREPRWVLSCDVDHPRLWWKPWELARTLGGALKRGHFVEEAVFWAKYLHRRPKDPFDTFDELMEWAEGQPVQFNFLGKRPRHFDCWYDIEHPIVRELIDDLAQKGHTIGFHPSREASDDPVRFGEELASVRKVAQVPVVSGRNHYLCFQSPHTWQLWDDFGMEMDSTLGYRDLPGFRSGICVDYPVFNFLTRKPLRLREQPLAIMDITFAEYCAQNETVNTAKIREIISCAYRNRGALTLLWHNSSIFTPKWTPQWETMRGVLDSVNRHYSYNETNKSDK